MTLHRAQVEPVKDNTTLSIAPSGRLLTRRLKIVTGDVIVLLAKAYTTTILDVFTIEELKLIPELKWSIRNRNGKIFEAKEAEVEVRPSVYLRIPVPVSIERTPRGYRAVVEAVVPANYKIHELSYLESQKPELYEQLELGQYE